MPAGRKSVKPTPVSAVAALVFAIVNVSDEDWPTLMLEGLNEEEMAGGAIPTISVAVVVLPAPPSFDVTAPLVLTLVPAVAPVMVKVTVHCALGAMVMPNIDMLLPPPPIVTTPPQVATPTV